MLPAWHVTSEKTNYAAARGPIPPRERRHDINPNHFDAEHPVKLVSDAEREPMNELDLISRVRKGGRLAFAGCLGVLAAHTPTCGLS
jgi:hypothetical protein